MIADDARMKLASNQIKAHDRGVQFATGSSRSCVFVLAGLAGTGKTVVLAQTIQTLVEKGVRVAPVAPTGRAALILSRKSNREATTIHKMLYRPVNDVRGIVRWERKAKLDCDVIVCDEASMVSLEVFQDLSDTGKPIIYVGDHGQLEPVGDDPEIMKHPDCVLEGIHRQAKGSQIIEFAHDVRAGKIPSQMRPYDTKAIITGRWREHAGAQIVKADMIVVGYNKTRQHINKVLRTHYARKGVVSIGDRITCLRNNRELGVINGISATVESIANANRDVMLLTVLPDSGTTMTVPVDRECLAADGIDYSELSRAPNDRTYWSYGYAITAHRAQGGEARRVVVYEQKAGWDMKRWRYTCASRAIRRLVYLW